MEKIYYINGKQFKEMAILGYRILEKDCELINSLNVFPVPDGDTGTNMRITFLTALNAIKDDEELKDIIPHFARGSLFGARGNSGVLLSQIIKGFAKAYNGEEKISVLEFADALVSGYKCAYECAINPVEGTILTVMREGIESAKEDIDNKTDYASFFVILRDAMVKSLENTPNLLPVLKLAGVIDSGGRGLLSIFEGFTIYFNSEENKNLVIVPSLDGNHNSDSPDFSLFNEDSVLDYGYCTEFLLQLMRSKIDIDAFDINAFIDEISKLGDSLVVTQDGYIVKVHIHTKTPANVLSFGQKFGEFLTMKIENMALQHNHVINKKRKNRAIISIASGEGITKLFKELGVDIVINGGQTMNTSTEEIVNAIKEVNADNVIILPNNSNILLACKQAKELCVDTNVIIVETTSIQEGYFGLSYMIGSEEDAEVLAEQINEGKDIISTCYVARANRDFTYEGGKGLNGDYLECVGDEIVGANKDLCEAALDLLSKIEDIEDKEIVFIFYGKDVSEEKAMMIQEAITSRFPLLEVGLIDGGQPVYELLIGVNR